MKLFDHSADRLADRTALLLTADPGDGLLDAARRYDPQVRRWAGRLVFSNVAAALHRAGSAGGRGWRCSSCSE